MSSLYYLLLSCCNALNCVYGAAAQFDISDFTFVRNIKKVMLKDFNSTYTNVLFVYEICF